MNRFNMMLKYNLKLLARNKLTFFLLIMVPILSTLILNIPAKSDDVASKFKLLVTVRDEANTELSKEVVRHLQDNKSLLITLQEEAMPKDKTPEEFFTERANRSDTGAFVLIPADFDQKILRGDFTHVISLYDRGNDDRSELLKTDLRFILTRLHLFSEVSKGNKKILDALIQATQNYVTKKEVQTIGDNKINKTPDISSSPLNLGFFMAIISMSMIFSGNIIVSLLIKERENRVLRRITLTNTKLFHYILVKLLIGIFSVGLQTLMIMVGIKFLTQLDLGISIWQMGLLVFGVGLVLLSVSICIGCFVGSIDKTNYITFCIVLLTDMIAGLYWPLEVSPKWMQNLATIIPQRWFIYTSNQLLAGYSNALWLYAAMIVSFMGFFLALTLLAIKVKKLNI